MERVLFIGAVVASGIMSDGKPWQSYRIAVGIYDYRTGKICKVDVFKAPCTDDIRLALDSVKPYTDIDCSFNRSGRVVEIRPVSK